MSFFPRIPIVEDGQTLSAVTLNIYTRALQYLLGYGHMSFSAHRSRHNTSYSSNWDTVWDAFGILSYKRLYMNAFFGSDSLSSKIAYFRLQVKDDTGSWLTIWSYNTGTPWETNRISGFIDLNPFPNLTVGHWYMFRMQTQTTDETYNCHFQPWMIAAAPEIIDYWGLPSWTEATVSSEVDFNTIRHNIYALYNSLPSYQVLSRSKEITNVQYQQWTNLTQFAIQKRGDHMLLGMQLQSGGPHKWRVLITNVSGVQSTLYESDVIPPTVAGYPLVTQEVILPGVRGDQFRLQFQTWSDSLANTIHGKRCYAFFESDLVPGWDWPDLLDWYHAETDVGPARLLLFNQALTSLYSGQEMFMRAQPLVGGLTWVSGDSVDFVGPHRHRWLIYYYDGSVPRPAVYYGPQFEYSHDLPTSPVDTIMSYDMANIEKLRPGMAISVSNVQFAAESDRVLT